MENLLKMKNFGCENIQYAIVSIVTKFVRKHRKNYKLISVPQGSIVSPVLHFSIIRLFIEILKFFSLVDKTPGKFCKKID